MLPLDDRTPAISVQDSNSSLPFKNYKRKRAFQILLLNESERIRQLIGIQRIRSKPPVAQETPVPNAMKELKNKMQIKRILRIQFHQMNMICSDGKH